MTAKDSSPRQRILYVHGHALKPAEPVLQDISRNAVRCGVLRDFPDDIAGFDATSFDFACYGDLTRPLLTSNGKAYDEELDIGDRRNALLALQSIPQRKKFGFRQYDALPGKSALKEFLADLGAPAIGALGMTLPLISKIAPDFAAYIRNEGGLGTAIRERVRHKITDAMRDGERLMILSHGMGSVVAFDVLWQLSRDERYAAHADTKLDCLVSMGAPLCDDHVRKHLLGAGAKGLERYPRNIISWHNIAAEDDYVCHDGTVADDFSAMMKERIVSRIQDYRIYNQAVRYGRSNPHSSVGYLIHPRLSKIVRDWICQSES